MDLDRRFADEALKNAKLVNLDLDAAARADAFKEAAAHMRVMAGMAELSPAASNVMRMMMAHEELWHDRSTFLMIAADKLSPPRNTAGDSEEVAMFLQLTDGRRDAMVDSDVDGVKGYFALEESSIAHVVRLVSGDKHPYEHGVAGLVRILDDGAYSVEDRK